VRGTIHYPVIESGRVDCPKDGCKGEIGLKEGNCGRCGTRIIRLYRHRRRCVKMTFRTNHNGHKEIS